MITAISSASVVRKVPPPKRSPDAKYDSRVLGHTDYFGDYVDAFYNDGYEAAVRADANRGPQGFLIEAVGTIRPHFHEVDQFQVVVAGSGRIGKHMADPVAVHYTDAYTPYGPIAAGANGISFYTLRPGADFGSHRMPGSEKDVRSGRSFTLETGLGAGPPRPFRDVATVEPVLPLQDDGLFGATIRIPPAASAEVPVGDGGGLYVIIVNGTCDFGSDPLPTRSLVWIGRDEHPLLATAGPDGADLLVLQFPR